VPCPRFVPDAGCDSQPGVVVDADLVRVACRRGYARDCCTYAALVEADAAQFLIRSHDGGVIEVAWSLERNHHPLAVGLIEIAAGCVVQTTLERQAHALASEYLRKTGKA
jgi:hypothetical protein